MLCEQLQQLRLQSGLVDLDIVCEVVAVDSFPLFMQFSPKKLFPFWILRIMIFGESRVN